MDQTKIYGVDLSQKITLLMVRDAIITCFLEAHAEVLALMKEYHEFKSEKEFEEMEKLDVELEVRLRFKEIGADFDNPTKEDLLGVIAKLAQFAQKFRRPEIVKQHYEEIMLLINKL